MSQMHTYADLVTTPTDRSNPVAGKGNLAAAKRAKKDEFYTQWADIEAEMVAYLEHNPDVFRDKTILLPCDPPDGSKFTAYFIVNFTKFGLDRKSVV